MQVKYDDFEGRAHVRKPSATSINGTAIVASWYRGIGSPLVTVISHLRKPNQMSDCVVDDFGSLVAVRTWR